MIKCWNCETEYNYSDHEVCPVCERHWLDARGTQPPRQRVLVAVDYEKEKFYVCDGKQDDRNFEEVERRYQEYLRQTPQELALDKDDWVVLQEWLEETGGKPIFQR